MILVNCLAYLGFTDLKQAERITLAEYQLRLEAYELRAIRKREDQAYQAWYNYAVQATTGGKNPKWKYASVQRFLKDVGITKSLSAINAQYGRSNDGDKENTTKLFQKRYKEFQELKKRRLIDMNAWKGGG